MAMRRRDRAFRKFRRERSDFNWNLFKTARNRCNQMVRNAKRKFILSNISSASSSGNIWKFLGTLGIEKWTKRFGLSVNLSKCQAIIIGSPRMVSTIDSATLPSIMFSGSAIPISRVVKDLGLHIDSTLGWRTQISNISQKVTSTLRSLYRLKNFLPVNIKIMLVHTLIFPVIDYGDVCYFEVNADLLDKLDRILNNCIRFVFNLRKYDHVSTYRKQLNWLPIRQRRSLRALTTLYSLLFSPNAPAYLTPHFQFLNSSHDLNLRSSHNLLLLCPPHTSGLVHSSFYIQSILLWNALPLEIRMSTSRMAFKAR
ncbi:hypothetical protein Cfor_00288, partial [Coptotermes formosanus]